MPTQVELMQTVMYLNNVGVSLMQKHCYAQANRTFTDALMLVKADADNAAMVDIGSKLLAASKSLLHPERDPVPALQLIVIEKEDLRQAQPIVFQGADENSHAISPGVAYPVRVESDPTDIAEGELCGIVMYNMAIVCICNGMLNKSLRLMRLGYDILSLSETDNDAPALTAFNLAIILLKTMLCVLAELGRRAEYARCADMLTRLSDEASTIVCPSSFFKSHAGAA